MSLLEVDDVHSYYDESHVLQGVSLSVEAGETVALIGRNGVGKTTTLRSILQLTPPRRGTVTYDGVDVTGRPTHEVARMGIGWVPEERRMFSHLTVDENIRIATPPDASVQTAFETAYDAFPDLADHRGREAGDLSGGQQQMVAIARGLAPQIVEAVADALSTVATETTVLLVEQNFPLAMDLADRFYLLDHGTVVESGSTEDVTRDDETIRRYLSA
jgi:branched-chain amino acid transport system ATP-binding protein